MKSSIATILGLSLLVLPRAVFAVPDGQGKRERVEALLSELVATPLAGAHGALGLAVFGEQVASAVKRFVSEWKSVGAVGTGERASYERHRRGRRGEVVRTGWLQREVGWLTAERSRHGGSASTIQPWPSGLGGTRHTLEVDADRGHVRLTVDDLRLSVTEAQLLPKLLGLLPMSLVRVTQPPKDKDQLREWNYLTLGRHRLRGAEAGPYDYTLHLGQRGQVSLAVPAFLGKRAFKK